VKEFANNSGTTIALWMDYKIPEFESLKKIPMQIFVLLAQELPE